MSVDMIYDKAVWDKFIDESLYGLLFHKWDFLKIVEKHTGYRLLPYGVYRGTELVCVYPLFYKKTMGIKMLFSPPPKSAVPYLGPVMGSRYNGLKQRRREAYLMDSIDEIQKEISRFLPDYTSVSLIPGFTDVRPFIWGGYSVSTHFSYFIDIDRTAGEIWDDFGKDCKSKIKKCSQNDITLEQTRDVGAFYDIMKERYGQQGLNLPIVSREYLSELVNSFPENLKAFYVRKGPEICDIELACGYKDRFMLWIGGAIIHKKVSGYQEYATWELIKKAKEDGYSDFEISGAGVKRICLFQSKFNPALKYDFSVRKMGLAGKAAEMAYNNILKKKWI